jgi:hypothetical protein
MIKRALVLIALLLAATMSYAGKTIELEVFRDWRGNDSQFKSSRPFFTITDIYELERFWSEANADESMPWLDFDKYMLLVWNPGPSLFDHQPVKVDKFLYRDGKFFVIMDLEKKATGGYWRRPFVATLLPKVKKGDLFIMRKEQVAYNKIKFRHEFTIWDMSPGRNMPFEVAKLETPEKKPEFIDPSLHPQDQVVAAAKTESQTRSSMNTGLVARPTVARVAQPARTVASAVERPVAKAEDAGFDDLFGGSTSSANSATKPTASAAKKEEKKDDDDFFPDFGPTKPAAAPQSKPKSSGATPPAADEDPLFGEEFDINF